MLLKTQPGDPLVILDMVMPGMGGEEAFLKIKEINPHIRALLSTGYRQDGLVPIVPK